MRLWSIHPRYLDAQGLVAAWREALLAQKVLRGRTKGYKNHPQLERFREQANPVGAIGRYLAGLLQEAEDRGYHFDGNKIVEPRFRLKLKVNEGQIEFEWRHLRRKLKHRAAPVYLRIKDVPKPDVHPLFRIVAGKKEAWEKG
jgi:hypothetical protein